MGSEVFLKAATEVFRLGKLSFLFIAGGFDDPENQRLKLTQMVVANGEIDAETVPRISMAVPEVHGEAGLEAASEANVVEFVAAVKRVDALPIPNIPANDGLIFLEGVTGDVLQMLTDELRLTGHRQSPFGMARNWREYSRGGFVVKGIVRRGERERGS